MTINKKLLYKITLAACLSIFFGYIGYNEYFSTQINEAHIQSTLESSQSSQNSSIVKTGEFYGAQRAAIAMAEYRKGVKEDVRGCNCGIEVDKYTEGTNEQWCTMFVSWVTKEAGAPFVDPKNESWRIIKSRTLADYLNQTGTWYDRQEVIDGNLEPRLGDFVVFWRGNFEDNLGHVDIVVKQADANGTVGLVGGNIRDRVDYREMTYKDNYGFLGFGRIEKN